MALLQLAPHRLQRFGQLAHLAPAGLRERRLSLAGGHPLGRPREPLDRPGHRLPDEDRHGRRGQRQDERQERHLGRHVAHQRHHAEGGLAHAHEPLVADGRAGDHDLHAVPILCLPHGEHGAALRVDDLDVGGDLAVGERRQHARELLGSLLHRRARRVQGARSQLRQDPRLVLRAALGEDRRARGEAVDDDDGEAGRQRQGGGGERQEDLQPEGQSAAPRGGQAPEGQQKADHEDQRQQREQPVSLQRHVPSLSR